MNNAAAILKPLTEIERLSPTTQKILKRAATHGVANSTPEAFAEVGKDWIMIQTGRGLRQVVITGERAYRL